MSGSPAWGPCRTSGTPLARPAVQVQANPPSYYTGRSLPVLPLKDTVVFPESVTPLAIADGAPWILVNRGWAPRNMADRTVLPTAPVGSGPLRIEGVLARRAPVPPPESGKAIRLPLYPFPPPRPPITPSR